MDYKEYRYYLNGVYKVKNNVKLYSLEIYKGTEQVFKSDWIYTDEKTAFKDAKEMINKNRFDTEIIRKNKRKDDLKKDFVYQGQKMMKISNDIIVTLLLLLCITHIISLFGLKEISHELSFCMYMYFGTGIIFIPLMLFWGLFAKGNYKLSDSQRKAYSAAWIFNLLYNRAFTPYNDQPFENKERGWYSSSTLIFMIVEAIPVTGILADCILNNRYSLLFYIVIINCIMSFTTYIFNIIWEYNDAKSKGEGFPFTKIIIPILTVLFIAFIVYLLF